ncbi:universal stress protein family protein [Rhizobium sp. PP-F2F-G20b]|nr:universal stress protein family protein [Rhizobium sp. PP-F2F-G20b]
MKNQFHLPLLTYPDATSFTLVQNAFGLARLLNADLDIHIHQVRIPTIPQPFPVVLDLETMRAEAERSSRDCGETLRGTVRSYAEETGVTTRTAAFECPETFVGSKLADLSRAYDLTTFEASETARPVIENVLFESGRPLLLFPAVNCACSFDTIAIAWDGSPTLARALTAARIFSGVSTKILLMTVTDDKTIETRDRDRFEAVLRNAGLSVDVVSVQSYGASPAGILQLEAAERGATLLVAGGFGHSRFREFILGGVTRSLLQTLEMPVLISH